MSTRFMFHSAGTSPLDTLGFDSQWGTTTGAVRLPMDVRNLMSAPTALADAVLSIANTGTQQNLHTQFVSNQIFKPIRITTDDWVSCIIRCFEDVIGVDAHLAMRVRGVSAVDGRELGGVFASSMATLTELATTAATRLIGNNAATIACSAVTINEPWRMVFELGVHLVTPAAGSVTMRPGCNAASDFAFTSALTTDLNPWWVFSRDLDALPAGFQHLRGFNIG